ncbi:monofunctional biosynthetic peptidoglycan transglycosylase [Sphingomonas parva]|uniref:Biosynthetic peptidoglycan transglycosylase n=1 Tax=Sphingomonas parva TaxID=2555898 RepID=A0A4Y8ZVG0_9SPHN|nr:monofunctional biosynthetic peptidoglycan transglycosylase [Sphingomonas parva]
MARAASRPAPARRRATRRGWPGRILGWAVKGVFLFVLLSVLWVFVYRFVNPPITFTMIGDMVSGRSAERDWMAIEEIDRDMVRAVVSAEDSKFCSHSGFDQDAIAEAMRRNANGGSVIRGGSTISQQTAKNAFLWQGGGYFRKGLEAWFTLLIENLWGKRRIMEVYLNVAETGIGTYGVNAGAQRYFDHDASTLSRVEAARIAAVLPLPKQRGAVAPKGFTRRYGNSIAARIGVVARDGLDACVYQNAAAARDPKEAPAPAKKKAAPRKAAPAPAALPGEEYERPQAIELPEPKVESPVQAPRETPAEPVEGNVL